MPETQTKFTILAVDDTPENLVWLEAYWRPSTS